MHAVGPTGKTKRRVGILRLLAVIVLTLLLLTLKIKNPPWTTLPKSTRTQKNSNSDSFVDPNAKLSIKTRSATIFNCCFVKVIDETR